MPFWIGSKFNTADDPTRDAPLRLPVAPPPQWILEGTNKNFESFDLRAQHLVYDASAPALSDLAVARAAPDSAIENVPAPLPTPDESLKVCARALTAVRVVGAGLPAFSPPVSVAIAGPISEAPVLSPLAALV